MKLVGFIGRMGTGKSSAASYFVENYGFRLCKFADPLKDMLRALGITTEELEEANLKMMPHELLCGKTPREAMQTLGTEWGRNMMGENFWLNAWSARVSGHNLVVCDDVRFPNEAERIAAMGGVLIKIERPGKGPSEDDHPSEALIDTLPHHVVIKNNGSLNQLGERAYAEAWK